MELQEELNALRSENKIYKDFVDNLNAEKMAIDQLLVDTLKNALHSKKELILKMEEIKKLNVEIEVLKKEKEVLRLELLSLNKEKIEL